MFTPEATSGLIGVFSEVPELREPLSYVAKAAAEVKGKV
jgi:methyl coenzyme M reductase beta subunit